MFVFNIKLNLKKFVKILFVIMAIIVSVLFLFSIYKIIRNSFKVKDDMTQNGIIYIEPENLDFIETVRKDFEAAGYSLPKIVLFNVEARKDTFLSQDENILFVSGQSPSVFKNLCGALEGKTAYDLMCEVLNNKVYDSVVI